MWRRPHQSLRRLVGDRPTAVDAVMLGTCSQGREALRSRALLGRRARKRERARARLSARAVDEAQESVDPRVGRDGLGAEALPEIVEEELELRLPDGEGAQKDAVAMWRDAHEDAMLIGGAARAPPGR